LKHSNTKNANPRELAHFEQAINRQNPPRGLITERASEKNKLARKFQFTYLPQSPP